MVSNASEITVSIAWENIMLLRKEDYQTCSDVLSAKRRKYVFKKRSTLRILGVVFFKYEKERYQTMSSFIRCRCC